MNNPMVLNFNIGHSWAYGRIGDDCVVAMGSMVMNDMEEETMAIGNPAKFIRRKKGSKVF